MVRVYTDLPLADYERVVMIGWQPCTTLAVYAPGMGSQNGISTQLLVAQPSICKGSCHLRVREGGSRRLAWHIAAL